MRQAAIGELGIWFDADADGIQDAGEPPLTGVTVNLLDGANNFTGSAWIPPSHSLVSVWRGR